MASLFQYKEITDLFLDDCTIYSPETERVYWRYNDDATTIVEYQASKADIERYEAEAEERGDDTTWYDVIFEHQKDYLYDGEEMLSVIRELLENGYEVIE